MQQQSAFEKLPLPSLLLKKSAANAAAAVAALTTTTTKTTAENTSNLSAGRRCIFGCDDNSVVLCRFPVHDRRRCDNWLKFFKVSEDFIQTHGLSNLRVCLKHFHQQNQMAKTRMKTTPTRLQKDSLMAEDIKKRLRQLSPAHTKPVLHATSSVLVGAPKRTNSISSATSSVSLASDAQSGHSDSELGSIATTAAIIKQPANVATPPPPTAAAKQQETTAAASAANVNAIKAQHGLLSKLKNRKVFMITESCDDIKAETDMQQTSNNPSTTAQKRKMYLIMEETPQQQQQQLTNGLSHNNNATKLFKNEFSGNASKQKLTLFADKSDALLTQKFEQILPEILNRIKNKVKEHTTTTTTTTTKEMAAPINIQQNGHSPQLATFIQHEESPRSPITLPPKKNRMKIINTAAPTSAPISCAATPVIVSATQVLATAKYKMEAATLGGNVIALPPTHHKNINLSADFLFLMKMLPKLEAIPEPHKNHVKNCIEKIVSQNATLFREQ